ncbi:MAG: ribosome maturation factor RimP [Bacteroidota bacterium]|nr:ribosome maturation factor RimP [Bacteroidota bacterium]
MQSELVQKIEQLVLPFAEAVGGFLVNVNIRGEHGSKVIEIFADTDDGITVDQCAELSRRVSVALDNEDIIAGRYRLEVSSPGLDHPLKLVRQYKKNVGRQLKVTAQSNGTTSVNTGVLEKADEANIVLKTPEGVEASFPLSSIVSATVIPNLRR